MKSALLIFLLLLKVALAEAEPSILPYWEKANREQMLKDGWVAGSPLLEAEPAPEQEISFGSINPTAEELSFNQAPENLIPEKYIDAYFDKKPDSFLLDPQVLLSAEAGKKLEKLLKYHASDSTIDMFVYVFGGDQEIPGDVREEEVVERLYSEGKSALIVYYYLGATDRSLVYLSPVIADAVSSSELRRAVQNAMIQAMNHSDQFDQIQEFIEQMSVRVYWMERIAEGTASETKETIPEAESAAAILDENELLVKEGEVIPEWAKLVGWVLGSCLFVLLTGWILTSWLRARARFIFPEFEVEPRLGASHAAGIGAVVSFSSPANPPARQRNQVPDYMRRA